MAKTVKIFGTGPGQALDRCEDENEDKVEMEYKCTPVNGDGWYKDDDPGAGLLVEKYYIPEGWRGQANQRLCMLLTMIPKECQKKSSIAV